MSNRKSEQWRKHPILQVGVRNMFPGLGNAIKIFAAYCVLEQAYYLYKTPAVENVDVGSYRYEIEERGKPPVLKKRKSF